MPRILQPLNPEQRAMAAAYFPLARKVSWPFRYRYPRLDDELDSEASLALVIASETWNPAIGVSFAFLVKLKVQKRCIYIVKKRLHGYNNTFHKLPLPEINSFRSGDEEQGQILFATPDDPVGSDLIYADELERLRKGL